MDKRVGMSVVWLLNIGVHCGTVAVQEAKLYLEHAVERAARGEGGTTDYDLARLKLRLGRVYWGLRDQGGPQRSHEEGDEGGSPREAGVPQDYAPMAHSCWLGAAAVEGPDEATAFAWLGEWYRVVRGDPARAGKCFRKALALDPKEDIAGTGPRLLSFGPVLLQPAVRFVIVPHISTLASSASWIKQYRVCKLMCTIVPGGPVHVLEHPSLRPPWFVKEGLSVCVHVHNANNKRKECFKTRS